ncbi:UDP-glucuronosyltransferase 1-2-like [Dunckerocampus dactyliophorus]|uniref:UDP-glucuronosyltransferase 1-2-like n=1 Tax=Dunckerocampus dactyliophorus TaxID=161453 RepID=UPI002405C247|nr:UDP-glucuronosyltransferase 1-2-like [Dunckerocampus dactyliophorus]
MTTITFTLLFTQVLCVFGGKILVFPLDGSHWVNMRGIIEVLHAKGHQITVVRAPDSWYIAEKSPFYTSVNLPGQDEFKHHFEVFVSQHLQMKLQGNPESLLHFWNNFQQDLMVINQLSVFHAKHCDAIVQMFENETLMQYFHGAKYDTVLTDPGIGGGTMLARRLQVPLIYNVRWHLQGEAHSLIAPSPLAYTPFIATLFTDKMTFIQRVYNVLAYTLGTLTISHITEHYYKSVVKRYFGADADYSTFFLDADIWLVRNDFVFEFPRPTMPNVIYMGGFQCKPPEQLSADLEEFVQSSGDHGIVVMTLGTLVGSLPRVLVEEIAAAFSQLPQKVIWRYLGEKPANLGNNTLLVKWLPQNNLLGHPKTRVFVSHGGTNSVQEAIYHGVPIVGLPLFFDQPANLNRIRAKGGAVNVDIATLDRRVFGAALMTVLHNSSYRENMQRLSRLHRDQPIKPMDQAVFWIEYVIRHKGAVHLKAKSIQMSWLVYHSLDIVAALLLAVLLGISTSFFVLKSIQRVLFGGKKTKQE